VFPDDLELSAVSMSSVISHEGLLALSKLNNTWDECVLRSTVHKGLTFEDGSDGKESRRGDLGVRSLDSSEDVARGIIHTRNNVTITLSVGSSEDNDAVKTVIHLKLAKVRTNLLEVSLLVGARNDIDCTTPS
jgi:hypothetical protein